MFEDDARSRTQKATAISSHWFSAAATPPTHTVAEELWLPAVPNARLIMGVCIRACTNRIAFFLHMEDVCESVKSCMVWILLLYLTVVLSSPKQWPASQTWAQSFSATPGVGRLYQGGGWRQEHLTLPNYRCADGHLTWSLLASLIPNN